MTPWTSRAAVARGGCLPVQSREDSEGARAAFIHSLTCPASSGRAVSVPAAPALSQGPEPYVPKQVGCRGEVRGASPSWV